MASWCPEVFSPSWLWTWSCGMLWVLGYEQVELEWLNLSSLVLPALFHQDNVPWATSESRKLKRPWSWPGCKTQKQETNKHCTPKRCCASLEDSNSRRWILVQTESTERERLMSTHYPATPRFPMSRITGKCLKNTVSRAPSTISARYGMNMLTLMILTEVLMEEWLRCCVKKPKTCLAHRLPARGNPPRDELSWAELWTLQLELQCYTVAYIMLVATWLASRCDKTWLGM